MTLGVKHGLLIEAWHQFCAVTLSASAARGPLRASRLPRPTVRACKHRSPGRWIGRSTPGQNKRLRPCVAFPEPASDGERTAASGDRRDARGTYRWQPSINGIQEARDHSAASAPRTAGLPGTWASRSATGCTRSVVHQWRSLRLWPSSAPLFYPDTFACVSAAPFSASGWIVLSRLFKSSRGDHGSP